VCRSNHWPWGTQIHGCHRSWRGDQGARPGAGSAVAGASGATLEPRLPPSQQPCRQGNHFVTAPEPTRERRALRARLQRPISYPQREIDRARFLYLDTEIYRARLPVLRADEIRQEHGSVWQRLAMPGLDDLTRLSLEQRQHVISAEISRRSGLPDLTNWYDLINFNPPVRHAPDQLQVGQAKGQIVNLDYYSVEITRMPQVSGRPMTPEEMLDLVRPRLNELMGDRTQWFDITFDAGFDAPVPPAGDATELGKVIGIDMGILDDGSVALTENTPTRFRFTTVNALGDFDHPVSGHREFGMIGHGNGRATFYTRGMDRPTGHIDGWLSSTVFGVAHGWWTGTQNGVVDLVTRLGGAATVVPPTIHRVEWSLVDQYLHHSAFFDVVDGILHDAGLPGGFADLKPVIDLDTAVTNEPPITDTDAPTASPALDPSIDGPMSMADGPYAVTLDPSTAGGMTLIPYAADEPDQKDQPVPGFDVDLSVTGYTESYSMDPSTIDHDGP
ncbi:MAG TPA: hypothetical protein VF163_21275, partial [Micromonosporaceae bacterium]